MELFVCTALLLALTLTGSNAQLSVCGVAPLNTKIVGGTDAAPGSWPWQASLQRATGHFCGGSLINNQYILTAAHCFPSTSTSGLIVYLGRQSQQSINTHEVFRFVSKVTVHPSYDKNTNDNDIALLQLSSTVTFTDYILPVCLAASDSTVGAGTTCWVTGWGDIRSDVPLPAPGTLQEVSMPIVSNADCDNDYGGGITNNMMCAGVPQGGVDSCQGDSGGPLVIKSNTTWIQAGVVSFGNGCAKPNFPGIYARVSQYQDWISSQISSDNEPGFVTLRSSSNIFATGTAHFICLSLLLSTLHVVFSLFVLS
ncbi:hypothetical protein Q5P01_016827 [Channa striata]|uniref:Peptidase S1 domain-containing protein n=1 Tax=Channa striata TaxID=64152 RepID=A0AA88M8Z1_CHASR|nr:hypothetical protein Q5P01_016827 [Channa striata]